VGSTLSRLILKIAGLHQILLKSSDARDLLIQAVTTHSPSIATQLLIRLDRPGVKTFLGSYGAILIGAMYHKLRPSLQAKDNWYGEAHALRNMIKDASSTMTVEWLNKHEKLRKTGDSESLAYLNLLISINSEPNHLKLSSTPKSID